MDRALEAGRRFNVVAMPTLLVLDSEGKELFRHVGLIAAEDLARRLGEIKTARPKE
jgi:hypothetical protein